MQEEEQYRTTVAIPGSRQIPVRRCEMEEEKKKIGKKVSLQRQCLRYIPSPLLYIVLCLNEKKGYK